jgi:hypothetical protein
MKILALHVEIGNNFEDSQFIQLPLPKKQSEEIEILLNKYEPKEE